MKAYIHAQLQYSCLSLSLATVQSMHVACHISLWEQGKFWGQRSIFFFWGGRVAAAYVTMYIVKWYHTVPWSFNKNLTKCQKYNNSYNAWIATVTVTMVFVRDFGGEGDKEKIWNGAPAPRPPVATCPVQSTALGLLSLIVTKQQTTNGLEVIHYK